MTLLNQACLICEGRSFAFRHFDIVWVHLLKQKYFPQTQTTKTDIMVQSSFNHGFSRSLVSLWVGRQWHVIIVFCLEPFIWSLNILKFYFKYPPLPYAFWLFSGGIFHCTGRCTNLSVLHMAHNRGGPLEKWMKLHLAEEHSRGESTVITPPLHLIPPLVASTLTTIACF